MSTRRRVFIGAAAAGLLVFAAITETWFVNPRVDNPGTADAIVVLAGGGNRVGWALDLAREGVATEVVFASAFVEDQGVWAAMPCNSIRPPDLPDATTFECFEPDPPTTRGEVRQIAVMADERGWETVVVVASTDQITRARLLLDRCWDGTVRFSGPDHHQPWPIRAVYEWGAMAKVTLLRGC